MSKLKKTDYLQQVSDNETAVILSELREILSHEVSGDVVEFGCYRGDTSLLMQKMLEREFPDSSSRLWIYDSFEGLPARTREDASVAGDSFKQGELLVTKREVVERFKKAGLHVPRIRKGFFENLSTDDLPSEIAFAFLDGDLYQSIKTSLELVTPRMNKHGVILVHDYNNPQLPGASRAVDEWLAKLSASTSAAQKTAPKLQRRETLAIISW
ncbi:class I SAM-dependent methyltransferase [Candidatus Saccharibacteria bacterium]|nr:class I SAM-dependent methyltransferase [Candidatus Saccharibacteria bacterium]MBR0416158.1 class I SAM-dependent methyltransferase [Candidatus Saccharibacteria bacterium]